MTISKTYIDFFKRTKNERIIFLRGGRRSGKTTANTYRFLAKAKHGERATVLITACSDSGDFAALENFKRDFGQWINKHIPRGRTTLKIANMTFIFAVFNSSDDAKGTGCDYLWIVEADNMDDEVFHTHCFRLQRYKF